MPAKHRRTVAAAFLTIAACYGCSATPASPGPSSPPHGSLPPASEDAIAAYGYPPVRTTPVTYQPDVVLLEDGAAAIRSVSGDSLTWTIDARARGASDLAVGKVMFATSTAVGRVAAIQDVGDTRVVTLAPVDLTEIIRDGDIHIDMPLNLDDFALQVIPDEPGVLSAPDSSDPTPPPVGNAPSGGVLSVWKKSGERVDYAMPAMRLVPRASADGQGGGPILAGEASPSGEESPEPSETPEPSLPPPLRLEHCAEVKVGNWVVNPCASEGRVAVQINHQAGEGLKFGATIALLTKDLRVVTHAPIVDGVMGAGEAVISGLSGLKLDIAGGIADPSDNDKLRMEVPVEVNFPIPPGADGLPIPINIKLEASLIVETAFSGRNSTMSANAAYRLDGDLGWRNGEFLSPTFGVDRSILDNIGGLPVGVSGVVVALKIRLQAGVGVEVASAGPYATIKVSVGVTQGSALGASLARCRGASLSIKGGFGLGLSLQGDKLGEIVEKIPVFGATLKLETEKTWDVIEPINVVVPNVPLCRG